MSGSLEERLATCVATVFPELSEGEVQRASSASVANWDSLAMVTLVALVEEEFGIRMGFDDYEYASSYSLLLNYLRSRGANG